MKVNIDKIDRMGGRVSEPGAIATGSRGTFGRILHFSEVPLDPVAIAPGSDTALTARVTS